MDWFGEVAAKNADKGEGGTSMTDVQSGGASIPAPGAGVGAGTAGSPAQTANTAQAANQTAQAAGPAGNGGGTPASHVRLDTTAIWLAYITTFGFFALIATLIVLDRWCPGCASQSTQTTQTGYRDILLTLMGIVGTAWAGIISFYFGSSVGSRTQSDTLQQISKGAAQTTGH